jgi:hypothetical protein
VVRRLPGIFCLERGLERLVSLGFSEVLSAVHDRRIYKNIPESIMRGKVMPSSQKNVHTLMHTPYMTKGTLKR